MTTAEFDFICNMIAGTSGIPIRHYYAKISHLFVNTVDFETDPAMPYLADMLSIDDSAAYYMVSESFFYGIINSGDHSIIIGPMPAFAPSHEAIFHLADAMGLDNKGRSLLSQKLASIPVFPLDRGLQMFALIHFYINQEMLSLDELLKHKYANRKENSAKLLNVAFLPESPADDAYAFTHSTAAFEEYLLDYVRHGDVENLEYFVTHVPYGNVGTVGQTPLRQLRNLFIGTATLVSRAAIEGGMAVEASYTLADRYILKVEQLNESDRILNLYLNMVLDFANEVSKVLLPHQNNRFIAKIRNYVRLHLHEPIRVDELADDMGISRTHLSAQFRQETGMAISQYIQSEKIREAEHLLRTSDSSLAEISSMLGYSSQSHFSTSFKKITGVSPKDYRG